MIMDLDSFCDLDMTKAVEEKHMVEGKYSIMLHN